MCIRRSSILIGTYLVVGTFALGLITVFIAHQVSEDSRSLTGQVSPMPCGVVGSPCGDDAICRRGTCGANGFCDFNIMNGCPAGQVCLTMANCGVMCPQGLVQDPLLNRCTQNQPGCQWYDPDGPLGIFGNNCCCPAASSSASPPPPPPPPVVCGNGVREGAEECDDGNTQDSNDGCTNQCTIHICGDSIVAGPASPRPEQCDDGNTVAGDGCDTCVLEPDPCPISQSPIRKFFAQLFPNLIAVQGCARCCTANGCIDMANTSDVVYQCETVNQGRYAGIGSCAQVPANYCAQVCGDGDVLNFGIDGIDEDGDGDDEECDDGNNANFDGCSASCKIECTSDAFCLGEPSFNHPGWSCQSDDCQTCSCQSFKCISGIRQPPGPNCTGIGGAAGGPGPTIGGTIAGGPGGSPSGGPGGADSGDNGGGNSSAAVSSGGASSSPAASSAASCMTLQQQYDCQDSCRDERRDCIRCAIGATSCSPRSTVSQCNTQTNTCYNNCGPLCQNSSASSCADRNTWNSCRQQCSSNLSTCLNNCFTNPTIRCDEACWSRHDACRDTCGSPCPASASSASACTSASNGAFQCTPGALVLCLCGCSMFEVLCTGCTPAPLCPVCSDNTYGCPVSSQSSSVGTAGSQGSATSGSLTHTACQGKACVIVSGAGKNECEQDKGCGVGTHTDCENGRCVLREGSGGNGCLKNADCPAGSSSSNTSGNSSSSNSGNGNSSVSSINNNDNSSSSSINTNGSSSSSYSGNGNSSSSSSNIIDNSSSSNKGCYDNNQCSTNLCISGRCEPCTANNQCPSGVCNNGTCTGCGSDNDCSEGAVCDDGRCIPCTADNQCPTNLCVNGTCEPCTKGTDCPSGVCMRDGICAPTAEHAVCGQDFSCKLVSGSGINECDPAFGCGEDFHTVCSNSLCEVLPGPGGLFCRTDSQCGNGASSSSQTTSSSKSSSSSSSSSAIIAFGSSASSQCTDNAQCAPEVCINGRCGPCTNNSQCDDGMCIDGGCRPQNQHLACMPDLTCQLVTGSGVDECSLAFGCGADLHTVCENAACEIRPGPGGFLCREDIDCDTASPPPIPPRGCTSDLQCSVGSCINGSCLPCSSYSECVAGACVNGKCGGPSLVAAAAVCGNGILDSGEECDDSNRVSNDGCSSVCTLEGVRAAAPSSICGNGIRETGEGCDAGTQNSNSPGAICRPTCVLPRCGDNVRDPNETCDDGNTVDNDGCDRYCRNESTLVASDRGSVIGDQVSGAMQNSQPITGNQSPITNISFPYSQFPTPYSQFPTPYALPYASLQPLIQQAPATTQSGPAAVAVIGAGAAAGLSWVRRRRK